MYTQYLPTITQIINIIQYIKTTNRKRAINSSGLYSTSILQIILWPSDFMEHI